ncbi:MAG: hypothetical protein AB8G86_19975 [Saprospiraceae bacterium]
MNINNAIKKLRGMVPGQMTEADQALVLNMMELVLQLLTKQQIELQSLKDEINRPKGEQGKPDIPGNTQKKDSNTESDVGSDSNNSPSNQEEEENMEPPKPPRNHSSEEERKDTNKSKGKKAFA